MKLSNFTYELPEKLLAEYPSDQRDESRLMVLHRDSNKIEHKLFKDVIDYSLLNFNRKAIWPSGKAVDCKSSIPSSNLGVALISFLGGMVKW